MPDYTKIPKTDRMATNTGIRAAVDGLQEILGSNGAKIVFMNVGQLPLFENPPEHDLNPCISADQQARIYLEIVNLVGINGAMSIWRRIGHMIAKSSFEIGKVFDVYKDLPEKEKFNKTLELLAIASGKGSATLQENGLNDFVLPDCLCCFDIETKKPICTLYNGVLKYVIEWSFGKDRYTIKETKCKGMGADVCSFTVVEHEE